MFRIVIVLTLLAFRFNVGVAADRPDWAFFVPSAQRTPQIDSLSELKAPQWSAPGSSRSYTHAQLRDALNPPDWYPQEHPAMPDVVAHGTPASGAGTAVLPCALCHLPNGAGHVESASLAGLPAIYIVHQLEDFRSGARHVIVGDAHAMALITTVKKSFTEEQLLAASKYFSSLKPRPWIRVVEASLVPKSFIDPDTLMRLPWPGGGTEPLDRRIVELPESVVSLVNRDSHSGFVAYVPVGSVAAGEALVTKGGPGRTLACASCHGSKLTGQGDTPPLAGRPPAYLVRQLWAFQSGSRAGALSAGMKPVVANLTADEMLNIAAYLASRPPR
jgi:cytochrome c553